MNWLSLVSIFARPVGAVINKGIAAGSAGFIGWAVAKGAPLNETTAIVSEVALAVSTIISGLAATQGVQIPIINKDDSNGVVVVSAAKADAQNIKPVNAPLA